jgi:hypothetical protein
VLDFKEIAGAHLGSGEQDAFEQFAADTLLAMGVESKYSCGRAVELEQRAWAFSAFNSCAIARSMVARSGKEQQIGFPVVVAFIM